MRISNYISRCLLGVATVALWCFMAVAPAKADVCFLPTGICELGARTKDADNKSCDYYVTKGIYSAVKQHEGCSLANIPGCTLWDCPAESCEDRGYKIGPTDDDVNYPAGYAASSWTCTPCQEGTKFKWQCSPNKCPAGKIKSECNAGEDWVEISSYGKSGEEPCGECQSNCPSGSSLTPTPGCYTCEIVKELDANRKCYKCKKMNSEYITQAAKDAQYDDSCYTYQTQQAGDLTMCYRPIDIECGKDQFKKTETVAGKMMCKCRDYTYEFRLKNASDGNIVLAANGQSKLVEIVSKRCGDGCEDWEYTIASISGNGQLKVTKVSNGTKLQIDGPVNKSQTTDLNYTIRLRQLWGDEATYSTDVYINVRVEHDTCPANAPQFTDTCQSGWKSKNEGTSVTGEKCYKCYNDTCNSGFSNKGVGGSCPPDGAYFVETTDYGSTCCKPKPDICPEGFTNIGTSSDCSASMGRVGNYQRRTTDFGHYCCKAEDDTCPAGYTKGPTPNDGHNYYEQSTAFGSNCYMAKPDTCPGSQEKEEDCPCGVSSTGDKTPFGTQCYYCKSCCQVGDNGAYGQPGQWGSKCLTDDDCQSSSDYSLLCVNKNEDGCGECKECGKTGGLDDCHALARRQAKSLKWFYIESTSGCENRGSGIALFENKCMVKDPRQTSACTGTQYPDVTHDSGEPYEFYKCTEPYDGTCADRCTEEGECVFSSSCD